jgi:hypothetical protein
MAATTTSKSKKKKLTPQFLTDEKGKRTSVVLPLKQFEELLEELEELEDIRIYDAAKLRKEEFIPFEDYLKKRQKKKNA